MKKKISVIVSVLLCAALMSACGEAPASRETSAATTIDTTPATEPVSKIASLEGGKAVIPDTVEVGEYDIPENSALAFVKDMKVGWNLGNTLEASTDGTVFESELDEETAWSGIKVTKELIDNVKNAGFNTVRIPVSWHNHLTDDEFTIDPVWLGRVHEIVDYVIDNDMYCIINIHHDISEDYYYPSSEHLDNSTKYVTNIWTQLSNEFMDYDDKLIFESVNEPRLVNTPYEWNFSNSNEACSDSAECISKLNQTFVDVVRASGGNNAQRYLMVPGYDASSDGAIAEKFVIPTDSVENKIIVSVHAYTPYNFALQDNTGTSTWSMDDANSTNPIDSFMDDLYEKYVSKGQAVLIGEFGARNKKENLQARVDFAAYYVASARARGMTCCWWDNNCFYGTGECFGIFDRSNVEWKFPDIVNAIIKYCE